MPRTYLVTGANRGLGLEFVRQLRARGERVIAAVRDVTKSSDAAASAHEIHPLDVADEKSINAFAKALQGKPIDVLIHNAGVMGADTSVAEVSFAEFRRVFDANTFGPAVLTKTLLPNLRAGERKMVLNISSTLGSISQAEGGFSYAYKASKAALNMITVAMHHDLAKEGFTCVTFCPGWNRTDMGGPNAPLEARDSIAKLLTVEARLTKRDSGNFYSHEGSPIPW